jgi:PAS domain S-box-containing protein
VSEPTPLRLDGPVLQALLDLLPGTLHVKDRALRYCIVNRTYLERWGANAQDVIGRTSEEAFGSFFGAGPDERNREVFATGRALPFYEVAYPDKRGGTVVLWSTKAPILDAHGHVTHVLTFSLDITPLKRAQAELERQRQALYQSERLSVLGTLAAGISHELRNPLSVVLSQAKLLEDELGEANPRARLDAISRAAERCAAIVAAFLDQARYGPRHAEHFALAKVIESALALTEHVLREQKVSVSVEHAQADVTVMGDPHQLSQVVLNLVLNAVTAMQESSAPKVLEIATDVDAAGETVDVTVADSGPGIAPELRSRIFERFFTTKAAGKGNGLGLAICRDIVFAHGGRISAHESPRGGAMFRVRLPLSRGVAAAAQPLPAVPSALPSHRILVVDDEAEIAHLLREILELAGHRVDIAESGEAALARIAQDEYEIILSDIRMAGMDGTKLYDVLRSRHPELVGRLAFVTGDTLSPNVGAFLRRSGLPYLAKPFHPRQVTELVAQLAGQHGQVD